MTKLNIAIVSPRQKAYSETFIQAHKENIYANIFFYYGSLFPIFLEGAEDACNVSKFKKGLLRAYGFLVKGISYYDLIESAKKSFLKNKIACVLAEYGPTGTALMPICDALNIPLIVHFHGYDASCNTILAKYGKRYQEMFCKARYLVVVSSIMKNKLISLGAPESKLILNPYGPHDSFFDVQPDYASFNCVSVGRFVEKKAPLTTIKSFSRVLEKFPQASLNMIGDGPLLAECKELVYALGVQKNISFLGRCGREKIAAVFAESRIFLQHSVTAKNGDMEGTPVAVLEAGAAALPVVATKHAGILDVVEHGRTGLLVEEHDEVGMGKHILALLEDQELCTVMGRNNRSNILKNFTMQKHISTLEKLIYGK